jgi:hypothetical protein
MLKNTKLFAGNFLILEIYKIDRFNSLVIRPSYPPDSYRDPPRGGPSVKNQPVGLV